MALEILNSNDTSGRVGARGVCPHCSVASLFVIVGGPFPRGDVSDTIQQCQSCTQTILLTVKTRRVGVGMAWDYKEHHPTNVADKQVSDLIPAPIRDDFKEALRCQGVLSYKATVVMCRRSLQTSCQDLKAEGGNLIAQIEDLAKKGKITNSLQDLAHQVRKIGNVGAHPDKDGLEDVNVADAEDIVEFMNQFFEHVYIMPARMEALRKRRAAPPGAPA